MHKLWTPRAGRKFQRLAWPSVLLLASSVVLSGQAVDLSRGSAPGIPGKGTGEAGGGRTLPIGFRYYGAITGIYDSSLQPVSVDEKGNPVVVKDLYGMEASIGLIGTHTTRRSRIAVDYRGAFRHYTVNNYYDGTDHGLGLNYSFQPARHWNFNASERFSTIAFGLGTVAYAGNVDTGAATNPSSQLFNTRNNLNQTGLYATYIPTNRTTITMGADYIYNTYKAQGFADSRGYYLTGKVARRLNRTVTAGGTYTFAQIRYPATGGDSTMHTAQGTLDTTIARRWRMILGLGLTKTEVLFPVIFRLDPFYALVLGRPTIEIPVNVSNIFPSASLELQRQFQRQLVSLNYFRGISAGNGVQATTRQEGVGFRYSMTTTSRLNWAINGNYVNSIGLGRAGDKYGVGLVGMGIVYRLGRGVQFITRYDYRHQAYTSASYTGTGSRVTIGLAFSPSNLPLPLF